MNAIRLEAVRRLYDGRAALDDVTLALPPGRITALLGPSGSGKSTLLRAVAGLEPIDAGQILFGEEVVSRPSFTLAPEARRVGLVFQDYALFPHLTALANVAFGITHLPRGEREREARRWLERVGLAARAGAFPHTLSGGEQQRVALARALAPSPRAVLLDEPFSGLDPTLRADLRSLTLETLRDARMTAVFVTHHADEALLVADRLAIMKAGKIVQDGAPRELYARPASVDAAAALGPVNLFHGVAREGRVDTPFGAAATELPDGASALVVAREEALALAAGEAAQVIDVRPQGGDDLVRVERGGVIWSARASARLGLAPGVRVGVTLDPEGVHVFAG
jgi:iron(III) transport system ATP-binding protein